MLMPTGSGKSLCYQIPALCREGVGVVVSPLIALMQDQIAALEQLGIAAAAINSSMSDIDVFRVKEKLENNQLDLLYVAPERLVMPDFLNLLEEVKIGLFAIDEAHCVSQWGHDFRPDYTALSLLADRFRDIPRVALTATADQATRKDIIDRLNLEKGRVFIGGFDRPNIHYSIHERNNPKNRSTTLSEIITLRTVALFTVSPGRRWMTWQNGCNPRGCMPCPTMPVYQRR